MALPRTQRLRRQKEILRVFRKSLRYETAEFLLRTHQKGGLPGQATVIVPKKVSKSAVIRNRLRRQAGEWFRTGVKIGERPMDCVLTVKPSPATASRRAFRSALLILGQKFRS